MGRSSRRKTKEVEVEEVVRRGLRPGAAALLLLGLGLGSMIVWNAFLGKHQPRNIEALLAEVPEGATTRVVVPGPSKGPGTITIKYERVVEDLQQELLSTGHYKGSVDGVMGNRTALAIKAYQKEFGLAVDGAATAALLDHIRFTRKITQASNQTGSVAPRELSTAHVSKPKKLLAAKPDQRRVITLDVQMRLKSLGYDPGNTDGFASESLRGAILQFEMDQGLAMEGRISKSFLAALKAAERGESLAAQ